MTMRRINFSNLDDGIDWENALPPHIVDLQERQRASQVRPPRRSMFNTWPLREESFPVPDSAHRSREVAPRAVAPLSVRPNGSRRALVDQRQQLIQDEWQRGPLLPIPSRNLRQVERAQPQRTIQPPPLQHQQRQSLIPNADSMFSVLSQIASDMINLHHQEMSMAFNDLVSTHMNFASAVASAAFSRQETRGATGGGSTTGSEPTYTSVLLSVEASSSNPPRITARVEQGTLQPGRRPRHINSSGATYDIITGWGAEPRRGTQYTSGGGAHTRDSGDSRWEINDFSYENLLQLDDRVTRTGLPQHQLRAMKPVTYSSIRPKGSKLNITKSGDDQEACAICLDKFDPEAMVLKIDCGHTFHHKCVTQWLVRSNCCPTCRHEIPRKGKNR